MTVLEKIKLEGEWVSFSASFCAFDVKRHSGIWACTKSNAEPGNLGGVLVSWSRQWEMEMREILTLWQGYQDFVWRLGGGRGGWCIFYGSLSRSSSSAL